MSIGEVSPNVIDDTRCLWHPEHPRVGRCMSCGTPTCNDCLKKAAYTNLLRCPACRMGPIFFYVLLWILPAALLGAATLVIGLYVLEVMAGARNHLSSFAIASLVLVPWACLAVGHWVYRTVILLVTGDQAKMLRLLFGAPGFVLYCLLGGTVWEHVKLWRLWSAVRQSRLENAASALAASAR